MDLMPVLVGTVVTTLFFYTISATRKSQGSFRKKPKDVVAFHTAAAPDEVFQIIHRYAQEYHFQTEEVSLKEGYVVLAQNPDHASHNGIWLGIYVSEPPGDQTTVEVAIVSKSMQLSGLDSVRARKVEELRAMMPIV